MATNVIKLAKRKSRKDWNKNLFIILGIGLPIIWFCIFWVYVNINSILLAFKNVQGEWDTTTLVKSWKEIFSSEELIEEEGIKIAVRNTCIFFGIDLLTIPFHVLIAYFFYRKVKGYRLFQIAFYLPGIISTVVMGAMFTEIIGTSGPIAEFLLEKFDYELADLLGTSRTAFPTVLIYSLWTCWGGRMLLLGGALARVPTEILEANRLDGAGTGREIFQMVFPLLWPTISTLIILTLTGFFAASGPIMVLTGGAYKTTTIAYWNYAKLKYEGLAAYNLIAANGLILTAIGLPIILGIRALIERIPTVEY